MHKAFLVGVIAGGGFMLANSFVPKVGNSMADVVIDLAVAGLVGMAAIHFLHR